MPPQTSAYVSSVPAKMRHCRVLVSAQSRSSTECLSQSLTPTTAPSPSCKNRLCSFVLCILPDMAAFLQVFLGPPYLPNPHWLTFCFHLLFVNDSLSSFSFLLFFPLLQSFTFNCPYFFLLHFFTPFFNSLTSTLLPSLLHPLYSDMSLSPSHWW